MKSNAVEIKKVRVAVVEEANIAANTQNDVAKTQNGVDCDSLVEVTAGFNFGSLVENVTKKVTQAKNTMLDPGTKRWIMNNLFCEKQPIEWYTKCLKGYALKDIKCFSDMFLNNPEELENFYVNRETSVSKIMDVVSRCPELSIEFFTDPEDYNIVVRPSPEFIGDYIEENYLKSGRAFNLKENLYYPQKCSVSFVKMMLRNPELLMDYNVFVEYGVSLDNVIKTAAERGYRLFPFVLRYTEDEGRECGLRAERVCDENNLPVKLHEINGKKLFSDMTNDEKLFHIAGLCGDHSHCLPAIANTKSGWMFEYKDIENKDYFHIFKSQTVDYTKEDWFTYQATVAEVKSFAQGTGFFDWSDFESAGTRHPFDCVIVQFSDKLVEKIIPSMLKEDVIYPIRSKSGNYIYMRAVLDFLNGKDEYAPGYVERFISLGDFVKVANKHGYVVKPYHMEEYEPKESLGYVVVTKQTVDSNEPQKSLGNKVKFLKDFVKK